MGDLPTTMKAWVALKVGKPKDVLVLKENYPIPSFPKAGEIMVRISYAALNPGDIKMMHHSVPFKSSSIPGMDFVGEIVQSGPSSSTENLQVGKIVAGTLPMLPIWQGFGTLAEYVVLPAHFVVEKPSNLDESVAAGLFGVAGQTTATLLRAAKMKQGEKALVNGASGGVGSLLVQLLPAMGVHVTAICSTKNEALVKRLGAEKVIDYTAHEDLCGYLTSTSNQQGAEEFDVILDCVGNETLYHRSPGYLKPSGKFLSIVDGPFGFLNRNNWIPVLLGGTPRYYSGVFSLPSGSSAGETADWFEKGWIKELPVDSVYDMDDAVQAFEKLGTGRTVGKIFVKVRE